MALHKQIEEGVYVAEVKVGSNKNNIFPALTFIGSAKTFGKTKCQAETYLLNFHENIYGKYLTIRLLKKLRGNKKFENAKALTAQMKKDELAAREFFGKKF